MGAPRFSAGRSGAAAAALRSERLQVLLPGEDTAAAPLKARSGSGCARNARVRRGFCFVLLSFAPFRSVSRVCGALHATRARKGQVPGQRPRKGGAVLRPRGTRPPTGRWAERLREVTSVVTMGNTSLLPSLPARPFLP